MKPLNIVGLFTAFVLMTCQGCDTASSVEDPDIQYFIKYYGGDGNQSGVDMLALDDGTFLLLGNYEETAYTDIYLVRVDDKGDVLWERRIRGEEGTTIWDAKDLDRSDDGNFVLLADFRSGPDAQSDIKLFKISPEGTPIDSVQFGTVANDFAKTVTPLADGGFLVSGTTEFTTTFNLVNDPDPDLGDSYNVRLNGDFELLPSNDWGPVINGFGSNFDASVRAFQLPGLDQFYVFGYTNSAFTGQNPNERLGLLYFEREGSGSVGRVHYPGNVLNVNDTEINFVDTAPAEMGGGYVIVGTSKNNVGLSNVFFARLRPSLTFSQGWQNDATYYNLLPFQRNIRGVAAATSVYGPFGYLILGNEVRSTGATNIWLSRIDQNANIKWSTTLGSETKDDFGAAVTQLPDGRIFVLGTMGLADNQQKMALIKINSEGQFLK